MVEVSDGGERLGTERGRVVDEIVQRDALVFEGRGPRRKRLRGGRALARHRALRHGTFLDGPDRLSGDPVEHEHEPLLGDLRHRLDLAPVDGDVDQVRRSGQVVVPEPVSNAQRWRPVTASIAAT